MGAVNCVFLFWLWKTLHLFVEATELHRTFFVAVYNTLLYFLAAVFSPFLSLQMEYLPTPEIFNLHQQDLPLEMALPFQRIETQKPKSTTATAKVTTKAGSKCKVVEVSESSSRKRKQPDSSKADTVQKRRNMSEKELEKVPLPSEKELSDLDPRQRRLVKNRAAAQLFRQRQKQHIADLEDRVNELMAENQQLNSRVELLTSENTLVKEQLNYLRASLSNLMSYAFQARQQPINSVVGQPVASVAYNNPTLCKESLEDLQKSAMMWT